MRTAARRLRLHDRVCHRPHVGRQPGAAHLRWRQRNHEGADRVLAVTDLRLHDLIETQARRTPDQVAVVFEHERMTYGELNRRADRLAHRLRGRGVGPDAIVGLFIERSVDMVVGILGILKAGAAYLPIDTGYPQERIAFMLADAGVAVVLTHSGLAARLPLDRARAVCLDGPGLDPSDGKTPSPAPAPVRPGQL